MYKFSSLLMVGAAVAVGVAAHADPNMPRRARTLRAELVRAYGSCTQPNETTGDGTISTCGPVTPLSSGFDFGPKGRGTVQIRMGGPIGNFLLLQVSLQDVNDIATNKPVEKVSFTLEYSLRVTTNFCTNDDVCTTVLITKDQKTKPCSRGSCVGIGIADLGGFLTPGFDASVQIEQVKVLDPNGNAFAVLGIARNSSE